MINDFNHIQAAHCENGVTTSLLKHHGIDIINEPLAFGIGSGLFYIHIPFMVVNGGPALSFRTMPGAIFQRTAKALDIKVKRKKFRSEEAANDYLKQMLDQGIPVGCQVGVFHLPYFPKEYRFHFNAHNLIVYGYENGEYLVSDPVMEGTNRLTEEELTKVRFAQGALAPKGHIYYPENIKEVDPETLKKAVRTGIKRNVRDMLKIPGSIAGVSGIKYTAGKVRKWREKLGVRRAGLYLGQIVRMQEEIGTGGGGFRFIYGAFLEQAADILGKDELLKVSEDITAAGDMWRNTAVQMAGVYKGRITEQKDFDETADMMIAIYEKEKETFKKLSKIKLN
ncbi:BtrH N-terminal domain-containing protein [Reichenbachiella ulvae]|uniref:BtrH N-terminal domain-containing protein n=1 Tax=Reichenbachiella ulvae TaxID=2980104 RepID=A0ABT3D0G8_9BACT|nr:BtrH N-terminal domain-containing protein [Reichenbachiella ulvae]MCV9389440.1 BtrH N-terminal domain-containing protein [Reichenbachiella ulvae]